MPLSRRAFLGSSLSTLAVTSIASTRVSAQTPPAESTGDDWPMYRGGPAHVGATSAPGPRGALVPLWHFTSDAVGPSNPVVANGALYVIGDDDILWSLDLATGKQRWAVSLGGSYDRGFHTVPAVTSGVLVAGSATGVLFGLDAGTGAERWRFPTGDVIVSAPLVAGVVAYVPSNDGFTYAVDVTSGKQVWKRETGPIFVSSPTLGGDAVFVGADDGTFYCLAAADGAVRWTAKAGRKMKTAAFSNGVVFVPNFDGRLYAFDAKTGDLRWVTPDVGLAETNNPAVLGNMVVVSIDGKGIFAFDAVTGAEQWSRLDFEGGYSSPVIAGDAVYVSVLGKEFATFDLTTGHTLSSYEIGFYAGAPAFVGGVLYIVANDGSAYALGTAPEDAATPIPLPEPSVGTLPTGAPLSQPPKSSLPVVGSFVRAITAAGEASDPLKGPEGIAVGEDGRLYVVDSLNDRLVVYGKNGDFLTTIGKSGTGDGEFSFHSEDGSSFLGDVLVGVGGILFVTDSFNHRLQQLDADGKYLLSIDLGDDSLPSGLAIDKSDGTLYVSDLGTNTVRAIGADGKPRRPIGPADKPTEFAAPFGLAVRADHSLLVCELSDSTVTRIDANGTKLGSIGRYGIADGRFRLTADIVADALGNLFVTDYIGGRIQVFDAAGTAIGLIGGPGTGDGQFGNPTYLAFGPDGLLYVSDDTAHRVLVFSVQLPNQVSPERWGLTAYLVSPRTVPIDDPL